MRITSSRDSFQQGPYNLGKLSILNGTLASIFLVSTSICFFFPTQFDANMKQSADSFNYTCVVFAAALVVAGTYWFLPKSMGGARHFFKGPVRPEDIAEDNEKFKEIKFQKKRTKSDSELKFEINPEIEELSFNDI